jgi:hypothetical protein
MQRRPTMTDRADSGTRAAEHIEEKLPGFLRIPEHKKSKHHHAAFYDTLERRLMIKNEIIAAVAEFVGTVMCVGRSSGSFSRTLTASPQQVPVLRILHCDASYEPRQRARGGGSQRAARPRGASVLVARLR